jgi:putative hydrolase of the HAD superfamily
MKPSKKAYSIVMDKLNSLAQSSVYVGDEGDDELQGANAAGFGLVIFMRGHVAKNGLRTQEVAGFTQVADFSIDNFAELPTLIERIESA